jgi:hypothetical protein
VASWLQDELVVVAAPGTGVTPSGDTGERVPLRTFIEQVVAEA